MHKLSNKQFSEIFDKIAPEYNKVSNSYLVNKRKEILGKWAQGKCLEVGAGTGEISRYLSQMHQVVATDIAPRMVSEIRKGDIEAYECDAEKLPFMEGSFGSVIAAEMLFYLDNPDNFLSEAYRVLKPDGRLLISCASNFPVKFYDRLRSSLRTIGIKSGMYFEDGLRKFMTPAKLKTTLARHDFKVVEIRKCPILPIASLDSLNQLLEKTPLKHFGIFIFVLAQKR